MRSSQQVCRMYHSTPLPPYYTSTVKSQPQVGSLVIVLYLNYILLQFQGECFQTYLLAESCLCHCRSLSYEQGFHPCHCLTLHLLNNLIGSKDAASLYVDRDVRIVAGDSLLEAGDELRLVNSLNGRVQVRVLFIVSDRILRS